jgi:phosphomannomutase
LGILFGTDCIRGVYGEYPLLPDFVMRFSQAAGLLLREKKQATPKVVIGRDTRGSGEIIQKCFGYWFYGERNRCWDVGVKQHLELHG